MRLTKHLLATTAAILPATELIGADLFLPVEPVDYVSVCNAYGDGFLTIPGTRTCVSVGGYVEIDVWINDSRSVANRYPARALIEGVPYRNSVFNDDGGIEGAGVYARDDYAASWSITSEANIKFTARSESDLGTVGAYFELEVESDNSEADGYEKLVTFDSGYGTIGPVTFGYTDTIYDYSGGFNLDGSLNADTTVKQIHVSRTTDRWSVAFALEDPRDRYYDDSKNATGDYPDIAAALTGTFRNADVQASLGLTDRTSRIGWGAQLAGTLDFGSGARLRGVAAYSRNAPVYVGGYNCSGSCVNEGAWWSTLLSAEVDLTASTVARTTASYLEGPSSYQWQAAAGGAWSLGSLSEIAAEVLYSNANGVDSVGFHTEFTTSFGG